MNTALKDKLRIIFYPIVLLKREVYSQYLRYLGLHNPKKLASILHYDYTKRHINWENPQDLNEKINWLKFNSDTAIWGELSDKYAVRKHIEDAGLGEMLVDLYGVWSSVEEINFDLLPQSFVLKSTNGSGTVIVVEDKNKLDYVEVKKTLKSWLSLKFGIMTAEPHYYPIKPQIIAEELLKNDKKDISSSLIDYKFWCFHGKVYSIWTCSDRVLKAGAALTYFDVNWKKKSDYLLTVDNYKSSINEIPKPKSFDKMISACEILAKDFPQVRVDFYEVNDQPYFGELTFTSEAGYMDVCTHEYLLMMGNQIKLPKN